MRIDGLRRFSRDNSANTAMLFGLSLLPLMALAGGAVDVERTTRVKGALTKAADLAALMAAREAAAAIGRGEANWASAGSARGASLFHTNARTVIDTSNITPTVTLTRAGQVVKAQVSFSASVPTSFLKLISMPSMSVRGSVEANANLPQYANVSLVLDVSPSMAIAATAADMTTMKALTQAQTGVDCAFACHDKDGSAALSNYQIARNSGVTLRIDIVKNAAQALSAYMSSAGVAPSQYTLGLYTLSSNLRTLQAPTSNFGVVNTAIGAVDFDTMSTLAPTLPPPAPAYLASGNLVTHYADSDFATSFNTLNSVVPADGSGVSSTSRSQIVFVVTDGVSDVGAIYNTSISAAYNHPAIPNFANGNDWGKVTSPIEATQCDSLKNRGVMVGVLYVPYVADPADGFYQHGVKTNAPPDAVEANLRACASPNLYYEASDLPGLTNGLRTLFNNATLQMSARLTH